MCTQYTYALYMCNSSSLQEFGRGGAHDLYLLKRNTRCCFLENKRLICQKHIIHCCILHILWFLWDISLIMGFPIISVEKLWFKYNLSCTAPCSIPKLGIAATLGIKPFWQLWKRSPTRVPDPLLCCNFAFTKDEGWRLFSWGLEIYFLEVSKSFFLGYQSHFLRVCQSIFLGSKV